MGGIVKQDFVRVACRSTKLGTPALGTASGNRQFNPWNADTAWPRYNEFWE